MAIKYYKNLDGVRAIAALMVMFFHFFNGVIADTKFLQIISKISIFGQTGVSLFFVLSGFLITRILLYSKEDKHYFRNFYLRRSLRIFPLYYMYLFICFFIVPYLFSTGGSSIKQQLYYYFYLQNFASTFDWSGWITPLGLGHFWSLAVEEHFYLFWPFVIYFVSEKNLKKVIISVIFTAFLLRVIMVNEGLNVFYFIFTRFDSLAIGALLALIEIRYSFKTIKSYKFLVLVAVLLVPTIFIWINFTGEGNNILQVCKYLLLSFTYFSMIGFILTLNSNNVLNKILKSSFFTFTGKISYGLYVYHPLVFYFSGIYLNSNSLFIDIITHFGLTYLVSSISYYMFEIKFLKLKKYFDYNRQKEISYNIKYERN